MKLYGNSAIFAELCDNLYRFAENRSVPLEKRDLEREAVSDCRHCVMVSFYPYQRDLNYRNLRQSAQ